MITPIELKQLKAFARVDGAVLGIVMCITCFISIVSLSSPQWQLTALLGMVSVPLFVGYRVRIYRDHIIQQRVSFQRATGYGMLCFMYASLILALASYIYFAYLDHGMMMTTIREYCSTPEMKEALKVYGVEKSMLEEQLDMMSQTRPVEVAFSMMSNTLMTGMICSIVIALFTRRNPKLVTR